MARVVNKLLFPPFLFITHSLSVSVQHDGQFNPIQEPPSAGVMNNNNNKSVSGQSKSAAPAPPSSPPTDQAAVDDAMDAFDGTETVVKISGGGWMDGMGWLGFNVPF